MKKKDFQLKQTAELLSSILPCSSELISLSVSISWILDLSLISVITASSALKLLTLNVPAQPL